MAVWIEPIFDRTQEDVDFAKQKIKEWVSEPLSNTYDLKGCLNLSDINRIEGNIAYLSEELDRLQYAPGTVSKTWQMNGLPTESDIKRILSNINLIISAYHQQSSAPPVPSSMKSFEDINAIEENLYMIKQLLDYMIESFSKCGTFKCGSSTLLPTRR